MTLLWKIPSVSRAHCGCSKAKENCGWEPRLWTSQVHFSPSEQTKVTFFSISSSGLWLKRLWKKIKTWNQVHEEKRGSQDVIPLVQQGGMQSRPEVGMAVSESTWQDYGWTEGEGFERWRNCGRRLKWVEKKKYWDKQRKKRGRIIIGSQWNIAHRSWARQSEEFIFRLTTNKL